MIRVIAASFLAASLSGCGLAYTVVKSEAKLDRLSVPMNKEGVVEQIGRPDRVLRDDGRVLVWEYSLTARKQWMYELALCPVSFWIGGCIIYPFTNVVTEHQREYPFHVVLVEDQLCAWGPAVAILQKRKACTSPPSGGPRFGNARAEPVVTGLGPISRDTIDRYPTMAVMPFEDAVGAAGSGARVSGIVTTLLLDLDLSIVERTKLEQVVKEQVLRLTRGDDTDALKVGKLAGANAIVVGEVQQWESDATARTSRVSLALRLIDVETGLLLFSGEGHMDDGVGDDQEYAARLIAHRILARFGAKTGLLGSGRIGVNWELREGDGTKFYLVRDVSPGLPAEKAGVQVGDRVLACNGKFLTTVTRERDAKRLCQVEAGQTLQLDVRRGGTLLEVRVVAEQRPGL
jgi:TolB-like protein